MDAPSRSPFGPLLAWSLPQLAVLLLMAFQIPWLPTKSMPRPAELMALRVMLVVQLTAAAVMLPLLFNDVRTTLLVLCTAIPMTLLAAFLSGEIARWKMGYAVIYVTTWIVGLALWSSALQGRRAKAIGAAAALVLLLGGAFAAYVRVEYGGGSDGWEISPISDVFDGVHNAALKLPQWYRLIGFFAVSFAVAAVARVVRAKKHPPTPTDPHQKIISVGDF